MGKYDGCKIVGKIPVVNTPHKKSPIVQEKTKHSSWETSTQKIKVKETERKNGDKDKYISVRNKKDDKTM